MHTPPLAVRHMYLDLDEGWVHGFLQKSVCKGLSMARGVETGLTGELPISQVLLLSFLGMLK